MVDLETTGGRARSTDGRPVDAITEIGAVKVRGGVVLGEFAILVDPQRSIPPQIVQLTGITTAMVCNAPTIDAVLPMFSGVRRRRGAGRSQRGLRHRIPEGRRRALRNPLAPTASAVHGAAGSAGAEPRGGPQRAAGRIGAAVRRRHPTHPPRPRRRARHRRGIARTHRASGQPGRAHLHRPALVSARRDTSPAPQKGARRRPAAPAGRLPVPRAVGRGAVRGHRRRFAPPGQPVLQRQPIPAAG